MALELPGQPAPPWPAEPSVEVVIPGRQQERIFGDNLSRDSFETIRERLIDQLTSDGDRGGPPGQVEGLPQNTPSADLCAYYLSFRFGDEWGIYIGIECWFAIARFLHVNGIPAAEAVDEAFMKLYRHEYFHFEVDKTVLLIERIVGHSTGNYRDFWIPYLRSNNPSLLEEALANAFAYRHAGTWSTKSSRKRIQQLLAHWMSHQPAGYRDFGSVKSGKKYADARARLLSDYAGILRRSTDFVPQLNVLLQPEAFRDKKKEQQLFNLKFEGRPLNIHFF